MDKFSQTLVSKLSLLQKRLESFIENDEFDSKVDDVEKIQSSFEASRDLSLIRGLSLGLPEDHIDKAVVIFSRLAMFFDSGVLLENNDGEWRAQARFHKGHTQLMKTRPSVKIPHVNVLSVLRTPSAPLLQKLNLQHLDAEEKSNCLLIKASGDYAFLLFSTLPDIWLKDHAENVRKSLINGFSD